MGDAYSACARAALLRRPSAILFSAFISLSAVSVFSGGALAADKTFNIAAEPLSQALIALAAQADISIGLAGVNLANKTSRDVVGYTNVEAALDRLLEGTGLGFQAIDPQTFRIYELAAVAPSPRQRAAAERPVETAPLRLPLIEEVTVTALKRPTSLQAIPLSLAVITSSLIRDYGLHSAEDATTLVAGVSSSNQGPGRNKLFVRGLSDGAFTGNTQAAVGVYIDETRATFNSPDPNLQLFDVDRVEIIRGPQGTLYGAGSVGGLFRIVTKMPAFGKFESQATVDGSLASLADVSGFASGMINIPLVGDKMAVRGVAYGRHDSGYIRNVRLGKGERNDTDTAGLRVGGRLRVTQDWTIRAGVIYQSIRSGDSQYYDRAMPRFTRANLVTEPNANRFLDLNVTVEGDMGWADIVSSTSWLAQRVKTRLDASPSLPILTNLPIEPTAFDQNSRYRTINHETRLVSVPGANFEWLTGVFFSRRNAGSDSKLSFITRPDGGIFYSKLRHDTGTEIALFGEVSLPLTESIKLTGGLRLYRGILNATANNSELIDVGPSEAVGNNTKNGFTPKASVSYRVDPSTLLYAEAAQGFRLGGVNIDSRVSVPTRRRNTNLTVSNFDSDRLWNFEIGSKSSFLNQSLIVNAAAFYAVWSNMQADLTRSNGISYTANLGRVRNPGFEIETVFAPTDRFHVVANLSWSNPKLAEYSMVEATISANRLPVVPKLAGTIAVQYEHPLAVDMTGFINLKSDFVGSARLTNSTMPNAMAQSYQSVNTRFGVQYGNTRVSLYVNNVLDSASNTYAFGNPFSLGQVNQVTPLRPRTVGLNLIWAN